MSGQTWAIIPAGGDGTRTQALMRLLDEPLPKQFATLLGSRSLLQATVERARAIAPPERTLVVVSRAYEEVARRQLADWPAIEIVVQPANRGTALGVLLPLACLRRRDPDASVAILPSDHYVPEPSPFVARLRAAVHAPGVTLLGIVPDRMEPEVGWIVPSLPVTGVIEKVARFVDKPSDAVAKQLFQRQALWNSFALTGRVHELWALIEAQLPREAAAFAAACEAAAIDELYRRPVGVNFSRAVLAPARELQVTRVAGSGWADWGTPDRIIESLTGSPALLPLLRRIIAGHRRGRGLTLPLASRLASAIHSSAWTHGHGQGV